MRIIFLFSVTMKDFLYNFRPLFITHILTFCSSKTQPPCIPTPTHKNYPYLTFWKKKTVANRFLTKSDIYQYFTLLIIPNQNLH